MSENPYESPKHVDPTTPFWKRDWFVIPTSFIGGATFSLWPMAWLIAGFKMAELSMFSTYSIWWYSSFVLMASLTLVLLAVKARRETKSRPKE